MPPPKVSSPSETDKRYQHEKQQELDLTSLRRQYNVLDRERTRIQLRCDPKLSKVTQVVSIFQNEYKNLITDLAVATGPVKLREDTIQFHQLSDLLGEYDLYNDKMKESKMHLKAVEGQIKEVSRRVQQMRKKQIIGEVEFKAFIHNASLTLETLENKLEVQMKKFNTIVAENAVLRNRIETLLVERHNFMNGFQKLIDKITSGKYIMLDLIEQATLAYDQKEEWCSKLRVMRVKALKDFNLNMEAIRTYQYKMEHGSQLNQFYTIKGQKRVLEDLMRKEKSKRFEMKKNLEEKLKAYNQIMLDIKDFTEEKITEKIALKYYQQENQNFSQFLYVIQHIRDMELTSDELGLLELDIEQQQIIQDYRKEYQKEKIYNLEMELEKTTKNTQEIKKDLDRVNSYLCDLIKGVSDLFALCKCSNDPLLKLLENNSRIKHYNILLYLQILESKIQQSLVEASYKEKSAEDKRSLKKLFRTFSSSITIRCTDEVIQSHPCALCLEHEMVSDVSETVHKPWSREETKQRLEQRLAAPEALTYVHTISKCHLPKSRRMIQQKYE